MSEENTIRESNFELMRLVLMFMIVMHHCIVHGVGLYEEGLYVSENSQIALSLVNAFLVVAVNAFVLISGYFSIRLKWQKVVRLMLWVMLYSWVFSLYNGNGICWENLLFLSHTSYWFITDYFFLMAFAPMINSFFEQCTLRQRLWMVAVMLVISIYFGHYNDNIVNIHGYTFFQFVTMYGAGRCIRLNKIDLGRNKALAIYILCSLVVGCVAAFQFVHGHRVTAIKQAYYNSPFVIAATLGLFFFFKRLHFSGRWVNYWAASALSIYLFQESGIVGKFNYSYVRELYVNMGGMKTMLLIVPISAIICVLALLVDKLLFQPVLNGSMVKVEKLVEKYKNNKVLK
ncbi:MAG: acyltransferase [Paludibacteraceae bacterium]|nr:acyltransferase [Paludibacteraceae bacterium]